MFINPKKKLVENSQKFLQIVLFRHYKLETKIHENKSRHQLCTNSVLFGHQMTLKFAYLIYLIAGICLVTVHVEEKRKNIQMLKYFVNVHNFCLNMLSGLFRDDIVSQVGIETFSCVLVFVHNSYSLLNISPVKESNVSPCKNYYGLPVRSRFCFLRFVSCILFLTSLALFLAFCTLPFYFVLLCICVRYIFNCCLYTS